jgi:hypothetical protein
MEKSQSGCINCDKNAVNNMIKIVKNQIKNKKRPQKYKRKTKKGFKTKEQLKKEK